MERITSIIWDWEREGWFPDCVVIDYADILAAPTGFRETNDQIDEVWERMRRLSQEIHGLVLTATQSSALAYGGKQKVLTRKHFSGRKTKLAHVTAMFGINITPEEEKETEPHLKGITAIQFIKTSNITIHTLDLLKSVYLNIFSCKDFDPEIVKQFTEEWFKGKIVNNHVIERK